MNPELEAFLDAWLEDAEGEVPFEAWMREALHHPAFGYYASRIRTVGYRGDFSTAATLHRGLGEAVAAWAVTRRREHFGGGIRRWHLVEIGPGGGDLAAAVLDALPARIRAGLVYHLVETSPGLRERQRDRLASRGSLLRLAARGVRIRWHDRVTSALEASRGRALVFSNELVDAFPVIAVRWKGGAWEELFLERRDGAWRESWHPLDPPRLAGYRRWLGEWAPLLRRGSVLTLDYGGPIQEILERRPKGTLRAFYHHQRYEGVGVYSRFGLQDITADVNFTDLARWGEVAGLATVRLEAQREFLLRYRPDLEARAGAEPELAYLLHAGGAGGAYWALEQRREQV